MEAIGDLESIGGSSSCGFSIATSPIPADDLGTPVLLKPGNHGLRLPIREEIDDPTPLQIHENGPIAVATTEGKVIDAQDSRRMPARDSGGTDRA
jgi:hypothetical protein